jgi:hypothetical protein
MRHELGKATGDAARTQTECPWEDNAVSGSERIAGGKDRPRGTKDGASSVARYLP